MENRMTITMDDAVYDGLIRVVGRGRVSQFLESLARPRMYSMPQWAKATVQWE